MRAEKDVRMLQSFARSTAKATGPIVIKHSSCNMGMMPVYSDFEYLKGQGQKPTRKVTNRQKSPVCCALYNINYLTDFDQTW